MNPALRPMSTGEILDRTFALYRKNFKLFVGISAIPAAFLFLARLLMLLLTTADTWAYQPGRAGVAAIIAAATTAVFGFIFYLVSIAVSQAATVFGVSDAHLEKPTSVRQCYARVKGHYWRMINLIVSVYLRVFGVLVLSYVGLFAVILVPRAFGNSYSSMVASVVLGVVVFAGFIVGIFLSIRLFAKYSLAVPACALEDIKARAAIKRSVFLSKGSIGKILAIYLLVIVLPSP